MTMIKHLVTAASLGLSLTACGSSQTESSTASTTATASKAVVISNVTAKPINGGINPDAFALVVTATYSSSNACMAAAAPVVFEQKTVGNVVTLTAVHVPTPVPLVCTAEFKPVLTTITTTVRGHHSAIRQVIVRNVGRIGHDVPTSSL